MASPTPPSVADAPKTGTPGVDAVAVPTTRSADLRPQTRDSPHQAAFPTPAGNDEPTRPPRIAVMTQGNRSSQVAKWCAVSMAPPAAAVAGPALFLWLPALTPPPYSILPSKSPPPDNLPRCRC